MDEFLLVDVRGRLDDEEAWDILRGAVTILLTANINSNLNQRTLLQTIPIRVSDPDPGG